MKGFNDRDRNCGLTSRSLRIPIISWSVLSEWQRQMTIIGNDMVKIGKSRLAFVVVTTDIAVLVREQD